MKKQLLFILLALLSANMFSQSFTDHFEDKTLRLDYIFSGNTESQSVTVRDLKQLPQWAGRRVNLDSLLLNGNGQIVVHDAATNDVIYREAFSSLFQEWLTTPEAQSVPKAFENTYLVPFPKNKVSVEVLFRKRDGQYESKCRLEIDPRDILIKKMDNKATPPYTYLHKGGEVEKTINVVIVAEGYTPSEMNKFKEHARITCEQIFAHEPFGEMKNRFNFVAVETPSMESGVGVPRNNEWKHTAFSSHFDTFYSERYLTTSHLFDLHDALAGIPYAHIIILANTSVYGGGGIFNAYTLTTTGHPNFEPVVVHEFGHSFAGLADEYFYLGDIFDDTYPHDVEPWEPNITTLTDFASKWEKQLSANTPVPTDINSAHKHKVGVYEGAGYSAKGIYRPTPDCRMKTNAFPVFCPVCQRAISDLVKFYTE